MLVAVLCVSISCESHVHEWTETIEKEAGCETEGLLVRTCGCGAREEEKIDPTGHKPAETEVVKAPTCTEKGVSQTVCPACKKVLSTFETAAKGHTPGATKVTKEPTCTEPGLAESVCTVCNANTGTQTVAALGHDWGTEEIVEESTCTKEGTAKQVCKRDSSHTRTGVIQKKNHIYTGEKTVKTEATCTEKGVAEVKCANCDSVVEIDIDALGHDFSTDKGTWKTDENGHECNGTAFEPGIKVYKCSRCEETEEREEWDESLKHTHAKIDETGGWDTSRENFFYRYLDSDNYYGNNTNATCAVPGKIYAYCSCFTDAANANKTVTEIETEGGNFYTESGDGRVRTMIGYQETALSTTHGETTDTTVPISSYFYGSYTTSKCNICGNEVGEKVYNETGKKSAVGRWTGSATLVGENEWVGSYNYYLNSDISLYSNGLSISKNYLEKTITKDGTTSSQKGDYLDQAFDSKADNSNLYRTIDGRWLSTTWGVGIYEKKNEYSDYTYKYQLINFASKNYDSSKDFIVAEENATEKIMRCDIFGSKDTLLELKCEEISAENNSVLAIKINELTALSFSETEGLNTVTIPASTESITLKCFSLTENSISNCSWTKDGATVSASTDTYVISKTDGNCTITCTIGDETHTVKIIFAQD